MPPDIYDVLTYPEKNSAKNMKHILDEVGVELIPFGEHKIFGVPVLGKGWSSVVVYGTFSNTEVAVKIQRTDSNRISLAREAAFLRTINPHNIGPPLLYEGDNFLILKYLEGTQIRKAPVKKSDILSFLLQCHNLDLLQIDHGQIQGGKHLIVGKKCWIIDFEKAGYRTPRNVSSLISEVFLKKTEFAQTMTSHYAINTDTLTEAVREYKKTYDISLITHAVGF
jgi:putative serine/threonine protein kinase